MNIRAVKWLTLGLFLALAAGFAAIAVGRMDRVARASHELRDQPFTLADALLRTHLSIHNLHSALREQIFAGDHPAVQRLLQRETDDDRALTGALNQVVAYQADNEQDMNDLVRTLSAWRDTRERVAELFLDGRWQDASFLLTSEGEQRYEDLYRVLEAALRAERSHTEALRAAAEDARRSANTLVLGLAVLAAGALAATGVGLATMVRTHRPMHRLSNHLLALADGDLHTPIPYATSDSAVGTLARAVATLRQGMIERDAAYRALGLSQQQLRDAMADVVQANAAKGRFLAAASHDLRQPLQALRLYLDTLEHRIDDRLSRRILAGAGSALGAAEDLLRNFLDVSVLEAGILHPKVTDLAVTELLDELRADCAGAASEKQLELRVAACAATIRSDPALLKRLLTNLVSNAIRYTASGRVLVGCRRQGGFLRIEVWDTGIGIPADQVHAVFEDFYQIGNPERDRAKGLGLGLSVVQRAADLLGHPISVASRPGRGSMFAVTVPLAAGPAERKGSLAAA